MSRRLAAALLITGALSVAFPAAAMVWHPAPVERGQRHGRLAAKVFLLNDGGGAQARLWSPDLRAAPLALAQDKAIVKPTGKNNYHALVAERVSGDVLEAAIRYVYFSGKPTGHSPSELTAAHKTAFEIVPDPLPREHRRYTTGTDAVFALRIEGRPTPGVKVSLATSNGSWLKGVSDARGLVRFALPDDFRAIKPGRRNNRPAEFSISARYRIGLQGYHTVLSAPYYVNPAHWQSRGLGALLTAGGFVAGALITGLGRRRNAVTNEKRGGT